MIAPDFSVKRPPAKCKRAACAQEFVPVTRNQEYCSQCKVVRNAERNRARWQKILKSRKEKR
jgi:hypothetical protein